MPKWGIFNATLFLDEHGHLPFLFQNCSSHKRNIQWTEFEQNIYCHFQRNYLKYHIGGYVWADRPTDLGGLSICKQYLLHDSQQTLVLPMNSNLTPKQDKPQTRIIRLRRTPLKVRAISAKSIR